MKRLNRQVLHLESSVEGITSRLELIMEKLGLQETAKGNKAAGKLTVTNNVSMEIGSNIPKPYMHQMLSFKED